MRPATAFSSFLGSFRASDCLIEKLIKQKVLSEDEWIARNRHSVSIMVASLAMLSIDDTLNNSVVILWLIIRAIRYKIPFEIPYAGKKDFLY